MSHFAIAGLQLNLKSKGNLDYVLDKIRYTKKRYPFVKMIVCSELAICGAGKGFAEPKLHEVTTVLCEVAKELSVWLVPGSIHEIDGDQTFNTAIVINPEGKLISKFRKLCPFLPYERGISAGENICCFDVPNVGRFGLFICYDIWFPEISRAMIADGAEVLLHPTLTDTNDRKIEKSMVVATAAQQQCYVVNINGAGDLGVGQSMLVGPEGDIIHESQSTEEILLFEADFNKVRRTRERGILCLGQPLKTYRDQILTKEKFKNLNESDFLNNLGELSIPSDES